MDASPVAMVGSGPTVSFRLDWGRLPARLHRVQVGFVRSGTLAYDSPRRSVSLDGANFDRFDASYEYRRYLFRNLLSVGLDVGLGFEGNVARQSLNHELHPTIRIRDTDTSTGTAGVVAAHLRRWQRVELEAAWVNGGAVVHSTQHHAADVTYSYSSFGGSWVTSLRLLGDVRVSRRASLAFAYTRDDGGLLSSHHGVASCDRRLAAGVTYER